MSTPNKAADELREFILAEGKGRQIYPGYNLKLLDAALAEAREEGRQELLGEYEVAEIADSGGADYKTLILRRSKP